MCSTRDRHYTTLYLKCSCFLDPFTSYFWIENDNQHFISMLLKTYFYKSPPWLEYLKSQANVHMFLIILVITFLTTLHELICIPYVFSTISFETPPTSPLSWGLHYVSPTSLRKNFLHMLLQLSFKSLKAKFVTLYN